eukprot:PITA_29961
MGFVKSDTDPNLYYVVVENEPLILVLYVDDLFLTGSSRLIRDCKKNLATEFDMKDLGQMHYFLGLEVWQQKGEIFLEKGRYATKILKRFRMEDYRPMATPMITNWKKIDASEDKDVDPTLYRELIGSLMYLVNSRPNICYVVNTLSQFMVEPKRAHWAAAKHVVRYLQGIVDYGLLYSRGKDIRLSGFTDADWAGSSEDQKSTSGAVAVSNSTMQHDEKEFAVQMQCWEEGPAATWMQRELQYKCSSGSDRAMGNSTRCRSAEDVGQGGLASTQVPMSYDHSNAECGRLLEHNPP